MKPRFLVTLLIFILLFFALGIGIINQQPALTMAYLCLTPFVGIALGRASVGAIRRIRVTFD